MKVLILLFIIALLAMMIWQRVVIHEQQQTIEYLTDQSCGDTDDDPPIDTFEF